MRLSSLTRPAVAGLFQASAVQQTSPHPVTRFPPSFSLREYEERRSRARTFRPLTGDETARALSGDRPRACADFALRPRGRAKVSLAPVFARASQVASL